MPMELPRPADARDLRVRALLGVGDGVVNDEEHAVAEVLTASPAPLSVDDIAARFTSRGAWKKRLPQLLSRGRTCSSRACGRAGAGRGSAHLRRDYGLVTQKTIQSKKSGAGTLNGCRSESGSSQRAGRTWR